MSFITYIPVLREIYVLGEKIFFFEYLTNSLFVFQHLENRDSSSVGLLVLRHFMTKNGCSLKMMSRRANLVDPYFASKSPGHDVTDVICDQPIVGTKFSFAHFF